MLFCIKLFYLIKKINSELAFVFSQLREEQLLLVPNEIQEVVANDFDEEIFSEFDPEKPFTEQALSEETLELLKDIFKNEDKII